MTKYSNASNHIDKSVIYVFLAVFLISVSVFAYRYSIYSPCKDVNFAINTKERTVETLIKFEDLTEQAQTWQWDFGDDTPKSSQKTPFHIYKEPGEYTVKLLVNNICERTEVITIEQKEEVIDSTKYPVFNVQKTIKVGQKLIVKDETDNASTWEWRFGENAGVDATSKNASYIYEKPGLKSITLIVNGDENFITKKIIDVIPIKEVKEDILDKPKVFVKPRVVIKDKPDIVIKDKPDGAEKIKKIPYISESDFSKKLMRVAKEEMSAKQFSEYFCGDINKPIIVNGKNTTFLLFCEKISGKKRTKIKKLQIFRSNKGSNCITNVTIDCKIPGLFND
ncbi:PKD domain-containing protein [uncultured Lacinutrix sp.]|uniref:PKD domain-containing protein n=1 Tax=uncultured Lacinutrix sp. TaxID=574032 RepID=UPI00261AB5CE|nr:PKD domain-containing protein [uncultured Lacinutrix sp.]